MTYNPELLVAVRSTRRRVLKSLLGTFGIVCATMLATSCTSGPYTAQMLAEGGAQLNPTFDGKPSAVNIRILPLIDKEAFDNASDADLRADPPKLPPGTWEQPHKEAVVYVGQQNLIPIEIKPKVRFIGVFGLFNEDSGSRRQVLPVGDIAGQKLVFDAFSITIAPRQKGDTK